MSTLQGIYFENMVGSISYNFSDVVTIGESIENGLKTGKISSTTSNLARAKKPQSNFNKEKEGETSVVMANVQPRYQAPMAHMPYYQFPYVASTQHQQPPFQYQPIPNQSGSLCVSSGHATVYPWGMPQNFTPQVANDGSFIPYQPMPLPLINGNVSIHTWGML